MKSENMRFVENVRNYLVGFRNCENHKYSTGLLI